MKQIAALAVLAAASATAAAQSSITIFGVVDVNVRSVNNSGQGSQTTLSNNGINSGRLGFRGVENLGGGWQASFWLETDLFADTGTVNATKLFSRQATVSLHGPFGELRLGRHYTPTGWNTFEFDPWSVIGVGGSAAIARFSNQRTFYRSDNAIHYYLPNLAGIYGQFTYAPSEGVADAKYRGGRLGYRAGSLNAAAAYGVQQVVGGEFKSASFGASYDFGMIRPMVQYNNDKLLNNEERRLLVGAVIKVGLGEIRTSYVRSDATGGTAAFNANDANLVTLGYVHNLSRRTALYVTGSRLDNKGAATFSIAGGAPGITPGGTSTAGEVGLRHLF